MCIRDRYVDDINGWNFLGQSDKENFEYVRLFKKSSPNDKMRSVYENEIFQAIEKNNQTISRIQDLSKLLLKSDSILSVSFGENYTIEKAKDLTNKSSFDHLEFY